jgi:hypothetical protein
MANMAEVKFINKIKQYYNMKIHYVLLVVGILLIMNIETISAGIFGEVPVLRAFNDTNASTECDGDNVFLDGNGNCVTAVNGSSWLFNGSQFITNQTGNVNITGNLLFDKSTRLIHDVEVRNLLDKTASETITGAWTFQGDANPFFQILTTGDIEILKIKTTESGQIDFGTNLIMNDNSISGIDILNFTDSQGTIAGIQNQNLLDKTAQETISGNWTFSNNITVEGNITSYEIIKTTGGGKCVEMFSESARSGLRWSLC